MPEYQKVLLLRSDGQVEEVKRINIKRDHYGRRSIAFDEGGNVKVGTIVDALENTAVGDSTNAIRKMKELRADNERMKSDNDNMRNRLTAHERKLTRVELDLKNTREMNNTLSRQRRELEADKSSLREKVRAVQEKNDNLMALKAAEEDTMPTKYDEPDTDAPKAPSLWDSIKADAIGGLKMGGAMAASQLTAQATTKMLGEIGVPQHALEHPVMKVLIQAGGPTAVRAICGFIPGVKDNETLGNFLAGAQKAGFANITQRTVQGATKLVMPMVGMLVGAANAQKELEGETEPEPTATVTQEDIPITVDDADEAEA